MDLSTQMLLVGVVSFVTPRVSHAACPPGHFSCHEDCCINEVQFCNNHETQQRCQKCELRKTECGTPNVHPHCFLFCRDFLAANSTTASPTPVLTPGILTAIIIPSAVLLFVFASTCTVILIKRPAWLTRITRRSWYRLVCRGRTKENTVNSADRDVEAVPNEQPNLEDLSLRDCQHAEEMPLLDRSGGSPAKGQAAEGTIEDTTVLASLHKRQSNGSLEPDAGPAILGDRGEAREASTTSRAERAPALQTEALQQRDLSDADQPSSRSPGEMASSSLSSAGLATASDGAASSLASSQASPSSAGRTSGRRRSDNDSPRRRGGGDDRGDGGSTRCFHDGRPGAGHPPNDDNAGPTRQRDGSVVQSNHTSIIMNFHQDNAHRPAPPADVTVSSPSTSAYFVHNGVPPGGTNAHQASAGDGGNPSRQPQQQSQNGSADQTPQCNGLHTNPTNPPDGDPGHTAEIATANDSQSTHQHYYHIPKPPA